MGYFRRLTTSQAIRPITAITKMNLTANQITPTTKCNKANATKAAMIAPPINSTRSKVFSPDRSSLTAANATAGLNSAIGALGQPGGRRRGGTVR